MKLSRQVGSQSQILNLFVQDFNVTTGAGLANVPASNVSYSWFRSNQNGVSTGTGGSTGTLGIYSSGAWLQINSATALGWYQFGLPNDALLSGDSVGIHFYVSSGPLTMAPLPVEIELTKTNNQQYASSTVYSSTQIVASVTSTLVVSTQTIDKGGYGVTTIASNITTNANVVQIQGSRAVTTAAGQFDVNVTRIQSSNAVTTSAGIFDVNVIQIYGSAAVTSASGQFRVSTQAIDKGGYGVTTIASNITTNANVIEAYGSAIVTSAAGEFKVSTQAIDKGGYGVTSISAAVTTTANVVQWLGVAAVGGNGHVGVDWANVTNKASYNDLSSTFISTNQAIAGASAPTAAQVAQAVWSEINSSYTGVSTFGYLSKQITSISAGVNVTAFSGAITTNANVLQIYGSAAVTSAAGVLNVSTQTLAGAGSVNVTSIMGQPAVTTGAGILLVSTQTIPTFAVAGDAMALTAGERASLAGVILTTTQPESYRSVNATGSVVQLMYEVLANVTDMGNSGTTRTLNSVTSHAAGTVQYQYDSTTPSAITRIA